MRSWLDKAQLQGVVRQLQRVVRKLRQVPLSAALMAAGCLLLVYVFWNYGSMYAEQKELEREWHEQQVATQSRVRTVTQSDGLIRLVIPSISLDAIVVDGTTHRDLLRGPGWIPDTARPGEDGNAVISAHRDTFFRHIVELKKGDLVEVSRNGKTFTYEVTGKRVVSPDDVSVLKPTKDRELTLITCYPTYYIGPAPDRLVVFTKAVEAAPQTSEIKTGAGGGTQ